MQGEDDDTRRQDPFGEAFKAAATPMMLIDAVMGTPLAVNSAFCRATGAGRARLMSGPIVESLAPDCIGDMNFALRAAFEGGASEATVGFATCLSRERPLPVDLRF